MYKLQEYEPTFTKSFKSLFNSTDEMHNAVYHYYVKLNPKDITASFLYACFVKMMRMCEWCVYDDMKEKYSDFSDDHLHTLLRHSFYATYHENVTDILAHEISAHSYNLRDF